MDMKKFALITSILLAVGPILSLSVYFFNEIRGLSRDQIIEAVSREAEIGSQNLSDFILERKGNLGEWAKSSAVRVAFEFHRPEGLKETLDYLKTQYPVYEWISVIDQNLKPFASTNRIEKSQSLQNLTLADPSINKNLLNNLTPYLQKFDNPSNSKALFLNNELYLIAKINEDIIKGFVVAKINQTTFLNFSKQVKEHLGRYSLNNIKIVYGENSVTNSLSSEEKIICSNTKKNLTSIPVCIQIPNSEIGTKLSKLTWAVSIVTLVFILITFLIINLIFGSTISIFYKLLASLNLVAEGDYKTISLGTNINEIKEAEKKYNLLIEKMKDANQKALETARLQANYEVALKVAHDIRSPLSVLTLMDHETSGLSPEKRQIIRDATRRVNDIANDIIIRHQKGSSIQTNLVSTETITNDLLTIEAIGPLIDSIVSEKRLEYRDNLNIKIEADLEDSFGLFIKINSSNLKRVLSNLVNNSIEAFANKTGKIVVGVRATEKTAKIFIYDNGSGIPSHILKDLGNKQISYGNKSSSTQSGSGVGVYYAKKLIEKDQGTFSIESREGQGTRVEIIFQRIEAPLWFPQDLPLTNDQSIIICDDDPLIKTLWEARFENTNHSIQHFLSITEFETWFNKNNSKKKNLIFLIDYELNHPSMTGLDLIEKYQLFKNTILVTSRAGEIELQLKCLQLGIKLLSKSQIHSLPIT